MTVYGNLMSVRSNRMLRVRDDVRQDTYTTCTYTNSREVRRCVPPKIFPLMVCALLAMRDNGKNSSLNDIYIYEEKINKHRKKNKKKIKVVDGYDTRLVFRF